LFLDIGDFPGQLLEVPIVLDPPSNIVFQFSGDIKRDGFSVFLPSDIEDGMFSPSMMAGAILFSTVAGGGDEGTFDPGVKGRYFLYGFKLFGS
jgi:hypothetical protein